MTTAHKAALAWVTIALTIVPLNIFLPQPFGPPALVAILEPYVVVSALLAGFAGVHVAPWSGRAMVLILLALAVVRYLPAWTSSPPKGGGEPLPVSTWNMQAGHDAVSRALEGIADSKADLMAIQELEPAVAAVLTPALTGFEFQALAPDLSVLDVGLLSRYPILESQVLSGGFALRVVVDHPMTGPLMVYVVHSPLGRYVHLGHVPVGVDLSVRDRAIGLITAGVREDLAQEATVIVLGDLNTTERETAYAWLSGGLRDAHLDAGVGPGFTWRPSPLSLLPLGILRIDYVLSTPDLVATSATVDCSVRSDHCRVDVELDMTTATSTREQPDTHRVRVDHAVSRQTS